MIYQYLTGVFYGHFRYGKDVAKEYLNLVEQRLGSSYVELHTS